MKDAEQEEIEVAAHPPGDDSSSDESPNLGRQNQPAHESSESMDVEAKDDELGPPPLTTVKTNYSILEYEPIPREERRGILARFALIPEVKHPTAYPRRTKWLITASVALAAAAAPIGSAIVMPALLPISRDFNVSPTITNLSVALYMLAMSIFPLWWSSFSETLGRRTIYITSFALFVIFAVLSAVSVNIGMLVAMRLLSGGAAASVQAVGAGSVADIWEPKERGRAMGIFYLGPLCGPLFAPIIGGAMTEGLGWRSTQWFLVVYGGCIMLFLVFAMPETLRKRRDIVKEAEQAAETSINDAPNNSLPGANSEKAIGAVLGRSERVAQRDTRPQIARSTTQQSVKVKTKKWVEVLKRCFVDPLRIILLLRFPVVAITVYYASIAFGTLYFLNISIQETFSRPPYNFSTTIVGLMYLPNSLGYMFASIFGGRWIDHIMKREARKAGRVDERGNLMFRPEDRMRENAWIGCCMFPAALLWYGWCVQKGVIWVAPIIGNFFFGAGSMLIFGMATTMLTEFMPRRASTGIAVNNFIRNIFSCVGGVVAAPIIHAIGNGWICTILAIVAFISGAAVILSMKRWGPRWRDEMEKKMEQ